MDRKQFTSDKTSPTKKQEEIHVKAKSGIMNMNLRIYSSSGVLKNALMPHYRKSICGQEC